MDFIKILFSNTLKICFFIQINIITLLVLNILGKYLFLKSQHKKRIYLPKNYIYFCKAVQFYLILKEIGMKLIREKNVLAKGLPLPLVLKNQLF